MVNHELEEGKVVLCTVENISKATVFVKIHEIGIPEEKQKQGSIVMSEIASGRIRNIRDYVIPKKKIVCKVLKISGDRIELSLRRVSQDEQKAVMEEHRQEKSHKAILKAVLGEKSKEIIKEIQKENSVHQFLQDAKQNAKKLEKLVGKKEAEKILEILNSQKQTTHSIKKIIKLKSFAPNGLEEIKDIFSEIKNAEIKYISAGNYSIKTDDKEKKLADRKLKDILDKIEKQAKKQEIEFSIKEK